MIKVTESTAIAELLSEFESNINGAHSIRGLAGRKSRAWEEIGEVHGRSARIIWMFDKEETTGIRRARLPFDDQHIKEIQIADQDEDFESDDL